MNLKLIAILFGALAIFLFYVAWAQVSNTEQKRTDTHVNDVPYNVARDDFTKYAKYRILPAAAQTHKVCSTLHKTAKGKLRRGAGRAGAIAALTVLCIDIYKLVKELVQAPKRTPGTSLEELLPSPKQAQETSTLENWLFKTDQTMQFQSNLNYNVSTAVDCKQN